MGVLGFGHGEGSGTPLAARLEALERQAEQEVRNLEALRAQIRERDEDRSLLLEATRRLKPGGDPKAAAETLFELCRGPFELCTYYLALVDYGRDRMTFPFYFEGGKHRNSRPAVYSEHRGLTGRALESREALYYLSKETQEAHGVVYSEAERITGLIPQTWYGVPLGIGEGWEELPFGLVSFQSFQKDAFSETRRALMDALGAALALALKSDPAKALVFS
ncbi:MAG TPA: GAF domain-containing protein [Holophagaceae bacterium]|nr:GAF domain-containing protein [Holophagaceae bacterium]